MARVCPDKGLHLLAEAFALLAEDTQVPPARLVAAGHLADADRNYLAQIEAGLAQRGLAGRFEYRGCLERREKIGLLQSLHVMSLPTALPESKGLPVLEAWANGVPVIVPGHGTFPELVGDTGGGLIVEPNNASSLAAALKELILDPARAAELGHRGQTAVHARYHADRLAHDTIALYRHLLDK
jgi:glycosyltransferase involved in cell wall biosynthesis